MANSNITNGSSGTIITDLYGNGKVYVTFNWEVTEYSLKYNTSTVNYTIKFKNGLNKSVKIVDLDISVYKNYRVYNTTEIQAYKKNTNVSSGAEITIASSSTIITHKQDGTAPLSYSCKMVVDNDSYNRNESFELPALDIPIKIVSCPQSVNDTSFPIILNIESNLNKENFKGYSTVYYGDPALPGIGDFFYETEVQNMSDYFIGSASFGDMYWFVISEDEIKEIYDCLYYTNDALLEIEIVEEVGLNITHVVKIPYKFTIINDDIVFTNVKFKDTNTKVAQIMGNQEVFIKGYSHVQLDVTQQNLAQGQKGAWIKKYEYYNVNGAVTKEYTNKEGNVPFTDDLGAVNFIGAEQFSITATDTRGHTKTVNKNIVSYDYSKPTITATASRVNNYENETTLKVYGNFTKVVVGDSTKITLQSVEYRYKEVGGEYSDWTTITTTLVDNKFTCNDVVLSLDKQKEFIFEARVTDNLETVTTTAKVEKGIPIFFISTNKEKCYIKDDEIDTIGRKLYYKYCSLSKISGITFSKDIWQDACQLFTTEVLPAGVYLFKFDVSVYATSSGMCRIQVLRDGQAYAGSRHDAQLYSQVASTVQIILYAKFSESKTHNFKFQISPTNTTVSINSTPSMEIIQIK